MKPWIVICLVLAVLGAFFFFCMNGYTYITYTLLFVAALLAVRHLCPVRAQRIIAVPVALGLAYFCFVEGLILSSSFPKNEEERSYLIVLGAQVRGTEPSVSLVHRLEGALDYLEAHPSCTAIVSGGKGSGEDLSEAECMKNWLTEHGIASERILIEDRSTSTMENLRFSKEILEENGGSADDVAILSSCYHLYRAKLMARSLGITAVGVRGRLGYPIYTLGMFIREAFGVTHLWVFGY